MRVMPNNAIKCKKPHINLQGDYDFSKEVLKDSIGFKLPELLELQVT